MPDVLRQNAPPVANDFLRSGLSPDEIDLVRKLVSATPLRRSNVALICQTLAPRGGNRTHAANVLGIFDPRLAQQASLYTSIWV